MPAPKKPNPTKSAMRVTSHDVARAAGVSQSVVSRTFSGKGSVSPRTRHHVYEVARGLGYVPNAFARGLSNQRSGIVGVLMGQIDNHFYPLVLEQLSAAFQYSQRQIMFFALSEDNLEELLAQAVQYRVDAMIATSVSLSSRIIEVFEEATIPLILFNRTLSDSRISTVASDHEMGGRLVADALTSSGHQKLAYVGGEPGAPTNVQRKAGFVAGLAQRSLRPVLELDGGFSYAWGQRAAEIILNSHQGVDACFCASDLIAFGIIDSFRKAGWRVPEDVSVVGFDDVPAASWDAYSLSTVRQPISQLVTSTVALIEQFDGTPRHVRLTPSFVRRKSLRTGLLPL